MTNHWLKVSDEYEKLQLIADGTVKAHMFVMYPLEDAQSAYDREAELLVMWEQFHAALHNDEQ